MQRGELPDLDQLGTIPPRVNQWHTSLGDGRTLLAPTPAYLKLVGVPDDGLNVAPKHINFLMGKVRSNLVAQDRDSVHQCGPYLSQIQQKGSRVPFYSLSLEDVETLKQAALSVGSAGLDFAIARVAESKRSDRLKARILKEAGFDHCYTCDAPVIDPDDSERDAKLQKIEAIAAGVSLCKCCERKCSLRQRTSVE